MSQFNIIRATTVSEIDNVLPIMRKLADKCGYSQFVGEAEHTTWVAINLPKPTFGLWYAIDKTGHAVGYLIAEVSLRYLHYEVSIVEAYMDEVDEEVSENMMSFLEKWAEDHQAMIMSCVTHRPSALARKYDFKEYGTIMMKYVGME